MWVTHHAAVGLLEFVDQVKNGVVSKRNDTLLLMLDGDEGSAEDGGVGADAGQNAQGALLSPTGSKSGALTPATPSTAARTAAAAAAAAATGTGTAAGATATGTTATGAGAVPDLSLPLRFAVGKHIFPHAALRM